MQAHVQIVVMSGGVIVEEGSHEEVSLKTNHQILPDKGARWIIFITTCTTPSC